MISLRSVDVPRRPIADLESVVGDARTGRLLARAAEFRQQLGDRVIWNLSSTATGGGVAEMLQAIVGYTRGLDVDIRWLVIGGDTDFFRITKRLHNRLHGQPGDGGPLGTRERAHFEEVLAATATALGDRIRPGDLVLVHDPQTVGLVGPLARRGAHVVWRCHIGIDRQNDLSTSAWEFLRPWLLAGAEGYVFSRPSYAPPFVPVERTWVIPPSIDPSSAKNQAMKDATVRAILVRLGVVSGDDGGGTPGYIGRDGLPGLVSRPATVVADSLPGPDDPLVVQVSRWDRLKDMIGVMRAFAAYVAPDGAGSLALVGPDVDGVVDDPEGAAVYAECLAEWRRLDPATRARILLVTLPMVDVDENAAMVNALQRHASVISQKSLAEGFGLTVAEGMWKGRAVVGSAVGGIIDQIVDGTGVLLPDPTNLTTYGHAVRGLLDNPQITLAMGAAAREHVLTNFLGDVHLLRYAELFSALMRGSGT